MSDVKKMKADLAEVQAAREALKVEREAAEATIKKAAAVTTDTSFLTVQPERVAAQPKQVNDYGFAMNHREFLKCIMDACQNPHKADKRILPLANVNIRKSQEEKGIFVKAAGSDENTGINDPFGGFLVPPQFSPEFLKVDPEVDPAQGKTRMIPMGGPIVKVNARTDKNHTTSVAGGLTFTRRPETVAGTSSRMQMEQISMEAHSLFGLAYATEEILTDSPQSFTALLSDGFSEQFGFHMANERLNGTGVGEYLGVWNALDANGAGPTVSVAKETGQAAATITIENVVKVRSRCWGYSKAVWIANHDTLPQLMLLNQPVGLGGAGMIWQPSMREDHPDMLLGRPLYFSEYAQTLGTQGDLGAYNFSQYLEGIYQPLQNDMSIHVRFINHERTFKFWTRNAGQPWWRTALTTKNSTNKLSPFVLLDTRS